MNQFKKAGLADSMPQRRIAASLMAAAVFATFAAPMAMAADAEATPEETPVKLETVVVSASADASAEGLSQPYAGGQVARGGRAGILGTKDNLDTPFSITSYTNELIQDQQAQSVGEVLQNDPGVRVARGFGNFQESYLIRGFILSSDDVAYNGLYSLLPRQYIATELFERVEVLRGASAFLNGVNPGGGGIGGAINLLPKRAPNTPLMRFTLGIDGNGEQGIGAIDIARRFGGDQAFGVRVNAAHRGGGTSVDDERANLGLLSTGLDWHSDKIRLSGDLGYQDNRLKQTRPNVSLVTTSVPRAPDASTNFAQPWSYSNERDLFGTFRGEYDITKSITAWAAYGLRRSSEANSLANPTVSNATTGDATTYRFDNTRKDKVDTGEVGLRGKLSTGPVSNEWVVSAAAFQINTRTAFLFDGGNTQATNIYAPIDSALPAFSSGTCCGGDLSSPQLTGRTHLSSVALGDTVGVLSDQVLLTLGLRHQNMKVESFGSAYSDNRNSPSAGLVFKATKQVSLYANYVEGLSQGATAPSTTTVGSTTVAVNNAGQQLAPYVSKQKEIGAKFDAGRIGGGIALFNTQKPRAYVNASQDFVAAGEDRHQGAELNVYGVAAKGVRVLGGITWLDAIQKSTGDATVDGKRVIGVPRLQGSLGSTWDVPLTALSLDARMVYTGSTYYDANNTLNVPGWTRFDIGSRYELNLGGHDLTLRARIGNVLDKNYWASSGGYPGSGYLVVGAPRTFALNASLDF